MVGLLGDPDLMRISMGFGDLMGTLNDAEGDIAKAATAAMRETIIDARDELRRQTVSSGLGARMANTWTARAYPAGEKNSINPAGFIWSRAPDIIDAFVRGAVIRPVNGSKFLWIPTDNVPAERGRVNRRGRNVKGGAITPEECENRFNTDFVMKPGRAGRLLAFMQLTRARSGRGLRRDTAGRRAQGRAGKLTLMYVLVPSLRMPKLLDLEGVAAKWSTSFETAFTNRLGR